MAKLDQLKNQCHAYLETDEEILYTVFGAYETTILNSKTIRNGIFAATNKKLVFYAKKLFGYDMEVFPYTNISSIEISKGILGHSIKFFSSGNKVSMKYISQGEVQEFVQHVKTAIQKVPSPKPNPPVAPDPSERLKNLNAMIEQGLITKTEYDEKRTKILAEV